MTYPENNFQCTLCGQCCSGLMSVFLNPHDLEKMRGKLGLDHNQEILDKGYIQVDRGQWDLLIPRVRFKKSGGDRFCPFLVNRIEEDGSYQGLCSLHPHLKPLVCALAPTARELDMETGESRFYFKEPLSGCPGCTSTIPYRINELFPQVEQELELEKEYLMEQKKLIHRGFSAEKILQEVFSLQLSVNPDGTDKE